MTTDREVALSEMEAIVSDFFAFQAAACTMQPGCACGRQHCGHCGALLEAPNTGCNACGGRQEP